MKILFPLPHTRVLFPKLALKIKTVNVVLKAGIQIQLMQQEMINLTALDECLAKGNCLIQSSYPSGPASAWHPTEQNSTAKYIKQADPYQPESRIKPA